MSIEEKVVELTKATTDLLQAVNARKAALDGAANTAIQHALAAAASAAKAAAQTIAAEQAAQQAQAFASQAQATNPDSPIRINPARIGGNFTLPAGYNGASAGPVSIDDGVTVRIQDGATWSIH